MEFARTGWIFGSFFTWSFLCTHCAHTALGNTTPLLYPQIVPRTYIQLLAVMVRPTLMKNSLKMSSADTIFQNMKQKLLNGNAQRTSNSTTRYNSVVKDATYNKDTITGIYEHPDMFSTLSKTKSEDPNDPLRKIFPKQRKTMQQSTMKRDSELEPSDRKLKPDFATTNLAKSNLKVRSEFDNIIKDWITTDWLDVNPVFQKKPCHIFVHDKLLCKNLSLLDVVDDAVRKFAPMIKVPRDVLQKAWNVETVKVLEHSDRLDTNQHAKLSLREIIKNVYSPDIRGNSTAESLLKALLKDKILHKKLLKSLKGTVSFDQSIYNKVKNFEGLNERNDITIIMDNEINLLPSLDYKSMLRSLNARQQEPLSKFNVLYSRTLLGSKVNDAQNLQALQSLLSSRELHRNERFVMITGERATSLEYYRQLKLHKKLYPSSNFKGCVIYFNPEEAKKTNEVIDPSKYTGKEMYYVAENFSQIYDLINLL